MISVHGSPRMKVALLLAHDLARLLVLTLPLALKNLRWFVSRSWLKGIAVLPSVALPPEASRYAPALRDAWPPSYLRRQIPAQIFSQSSYEIGDRHTSAFLSSSSFLSSLTTSARAARSLFLVSGRREMRDNWSMRPKTAVMRGASTAQMIAMSARMR